MKTKELREYLMQNGIQHFQDKEIGPYLTLGIGGKVRTLIILEKREELEGTLKHLQTNSKGKQNGRAFILLGGGSNVVFPDTDLEIPVIINRTHKIEKVPSNSYKGEHQLLRVDSGVTNQRLLSWNVEHSVGGMEFLAGIPGTVGGAAAVNAGAFGRSISEILERADIFTEQGKVETVGAEYFGYEYRNSVFKYGSEVILTLYLRYTDKDSEVIRQEVKANIQYRRDHHPAYSERSAGCFFKNPVIDGAKVSAGKLIDQCGLKQAEHKELQISPQHANFLINRGDAHFSDLSQFSKTIEERVYKRTGIHLEREVIYISPEGQKY